MDPDRPVVRDAEQRPGAAVREPRADREGRCRVEGREQDPEAAREEHPVVGRPDDEGDDLPGDDDEPGGLGGGRDPGEAVVVVRDRQGEHRAGAEERQRRPAARGGRVVAEQGGEDVQHGPGDGQRQESEPDEMHREEHLGRGDPRIGEPRRRGHERDRGREPGDERREEVGGDECGRRRPADPGASGHAVASARGNSTLFSSWMCWCRSSSSSRRPSSVARCVLQSARSRS